MAPYDGLDDSAEGATDVRRCVRPCALTGSVALANGAEKDGRASKVGELLNSGVLLLILISGPEA